MKRRHLHSLASFTLIELLTVIFIIAILAGLTLAAFSGVMKTAARSRARSEIQAISAALASYDADNGAYIPSGGFTDTNGYLLDASPAANYQTSSEALYQNLTGQTNFGDPPPATSVKIYIAFKSSQLGQAGTLMYIQDPFGNPYGYFTGSATASPVNGANQFDLWSTGGDTTGTAAGKASWISNWGQGE